MKEAVYVLGSGSLALSCAEYIKNQGISVSLYDTTENPSGLLKRQAELKGIPYKKESREEVFQMFLGLETDLLLVSAINEWLIPGRVLERPNITAVNLHQALLPKHPGRNAEAWAIFEQDKTSGITWHLMEEKVDGGDILLQKEIPLDEKTTSIALFRRQIACAYEGFQEIFLPLMEGTYQGTPQSAAKVTEYHWKRDVPGGGWLDTEWPAEKISAFLRAMDYGGLQIWEPPRIRLGQGCFTWKKYKLVKALGRKMQRIDVKADGSILIQKDNMEISLSNCRKLEEETWTN